MNSNTLKVLALQAIEPPDLLSEALTDDLFEKVKIRRVPVRIFNYQHNQPWLGTCDDQEYTEAQEIYMATELFDVRSERLRSRQVADIVNVYLHECAHRLTPGRWHDACFLCVNMLLHIRAGNNQIRKVSVYDFHQEEYFEEAWSWAWALANELNGTDLSAEKCSAIVLKKYTAWVERMKYAPALEAEQIAKQNLESRITELHIEKIKQDRWLFALGFSILTFMITYKFF